MNNAKKTLTTLAATTLVLGLAACGPLDEPTLGDAPASSAAEESPTAEPEGVGTFGQVSSWDGLDLVVTKPKAYTPSEMAAGAEQFDHSVAMDIKLTNTSNEPFDPSLIYITASSGEHEASQVFDMQSGIEMAPSTKILPGKSVKWTMVFNVADPKDVLVEVMPDFTTRSVLFSTGS